MEPQATLVPFIARYPTAAPHYRPVQDALPYRQFRPVIRLLADFPRPCVVFTMLAVFAQ
jgi:hypothetical protein